MKKETVMEMLGCIKLRRELPEPMFSVAKMLEQGEMESYRRICLERIAEALYIDGNHVILEVVDTEIDISVDRIGIVKCKDILLGYISEETYNYYEESIFLLSENVHGKNRILRTLKRFSREDLLNGMKEGLSSKDTDQKDIGMLCRAELDARKVGNRIKNTIKYKVHNTFYMDLKYYSVFKAVKKCLKQDNECRSNGVRRKRDWITYYEALERFHEKHGKYFKPEELNKEEILKYIYLVVNTNNRSRFVKGEVLTLEELERCGEAIDLLTPKELQQLFPIRKEFDGVRYQSKDYYFSIQKIRERGEELPIKEHGKGVFDFLWDYDNHELSEYMIDYLTRMEKIYVAQGHKSFLEEFFSNESILLSEEMQSQVSL